MIDLSVCMAYYDNPTMLARHLAALHGLRADLKSRIEYVVCDDGSPRWPAGGLIGGVYNAKIYRIGVDVRWNQDAARNICVKHAVADWILLTDIDHFVPPATVEAVLDGNRDRSKVFRFSRVTTLDKSFIRVTPYKPHPNSWLMTRDMYERIGGYDERFAGYYGTDADFRDRVQRCASSIEMLKETIVRVPREIIADASTTTYVRKAPEDKRLGHLMMIRDSVPGWKPLRGTFEYSEVECTALCK